MTTSPRLPRNAWYAIRWSILQRDNFTCQYCGQFAPNVMLEVDHRIAVCDGGTDEDDNLVTACTACNRGKEGYRAAIHGRRGGRVGFPDARPMTLLDRIEDRLRQSNATTAELSRDLGVTETTIQKAMKRSGDRFNRAVTGGPGRGNATIWALAEDDGLPW